VPASKSGDVEFPALAKGLTVFSPAIPHGLNGPVPITVNVVRTSNPAITPTAPPPDTLQADGLFNLALTVYHLPDTNAFRIGVTNVSAQNEGVFVVRWTAFQA
jgi:hypothetical protein